MYKLFKDLNIKNNDKFDEYEFNIDYIINKIEHKSKNTSSTKLNKFINDTIRSISYYETQLLKIDTNQITTKNTYYNSTSSYIKVKEIITIINDWDTLYLNGVKIKITFMIIYNKYASDSHIYIIINHEQNYGILFIHKNEYLTNTSFIINLCNCKIIRFNEFKIFRIVTSDAASHIIFRIMDKKVIHNSIYKKPIPYEELLNKKLLYIPNYSILVEYSSYENLIEIVLRR